MTAEWIKKAQSEQACIKAREAVGRQGEQILKLFAKRVNEAAGKDAVRVSAVHSSRPEEVPFAYLSITNSFDTKTVAVRSLFSETGYTDETHTAVYTVNFGTVRHGRLSRLFGAAASEPGIGVNKAYVHIAYSGSHTSVPKGALRPLGKADGTNHDAITAVMKEIFRSLPESIRARVDLGDLQSPASRYPERAPA